MEVTSTPWLTDLESLIGMLRSQLEQWVKLNLDNVWNELERHKDILAEFEKWKNVAIKKNIQDVQRMRDLEKKILDLNHAVNHLLADFEVGYREKKPHTCPICSGLGYWPVKLITKDDDLRQSLSFAKELLCRSCEGKGMVWG